MTSHSQCPGFSFAQKLVANGKVIVNSDFKLGIYASLKDVNTEEWNRVAASITSLTTNYLKVLETVEVEGVQNIYTTFEVKGEVVGIAVFQKLFFTGAALRPYLPQHKQVFKKAFFNVISKLTAALKGHILVLGNLLITADNGFKFKNRFCPQQISDLLKEAADKIVAGSNDKIALTILSDFPESFANQTVADNFCGYKMFEADPNMVMHAQSFENFDGYMNALSSKYRVRAKKILKESSDLVQFEITPLNFEQYRNDINALYKNVMEKIPFKMAEVNAEYFHQLLINLEGNFKVYGYLLNEKLVGFITTFLQGGHYEVHLIGLDYSINKKIKLYNRILYDLVELALNEGYRTISYGRTANEIKSTLGAAPEKMICYMKHRNVAMNQLVGLLIKVFKPKEWEQRHPFKTRQPNVKVQVAKTIH